jgi:hypothetical protein
MLNGDGDAERRELARLFDEQDRTLAEARAEAAHKELTQRVDESGLMYRNHEPAPEPDWSNWENWLQGHQKILKTEILDRILNSVPEFVCLYVREKFEQRDRKIADLEAELVECKAMLSEALSKLAEVRKIAEAEAQEQGAAIAKLERAELTRQVRDKTLIERSDRISELQRSNAASRAELARQEFDRAFATRDAELRTMQEKFDMLLRFLSLSQNLPQGL